MLEIAKIGRGKSLLFIHGWGLNSGVWQPCVDALKENYTVNTVDLPGFGLNVDNSISPYSLENIAKKIADVIDEPTTIIGWSLGGLVAREIALSFPKKVNALVSVASSPYFLAEENWPGIQPNVLKLFFRQLEDDTKKTINNFLKIQAMGSEHVRQDIKLIRDLVMQYKMPSKDTLHDSLVLLEQVDQRNKLSDIEVPLLNIYGKLDGLVPKASIDKISQLIASSNHSEDVVIFEKSSHAPFISEHKAFINMLDNWLQRHVK